MGFIKKELHITEFFSIRFKKCLPNLVIHEKYEKKCKNFLRILAIISILSSVIIFPTWLMSLGFSILIFIIEYLFEKSIFIYSSIFIQPPPNFTIDGERWRGMGYLISDSNNLNKLSLIGPAFDSKEYAQKIFTLFKAWNYNNVEDVEDNIKLSFIIEDEKNYSTYIYPSFERKIIKDFHKKVEKENELKKFGKEHNPSIMALILCKIFPYSKKSFLNQFTEGQKNKEAFLFTAFLYNKDGSFSLITEIDPIIKFHYKFKHRKDLQKKEYEYTHGKSVMNK